MVSYRAFFEPADEGGFVVTFPDFGYGVTQGETVAEAGAMASDLLGCLIGDKIAAGEALPLASLRRGNKYREVRPSALVATKAELYLAFLGSGIRKSEMARRMGIPKTNVDRLFDVKYNTRLDQMEAAFRAVGKRMVVEIQDAAA